MHPTLLDVLAFAWTLHRVFHRVYTIILDVKLLARHELNAVNTRARRIIQTIAHPIASRIRNDLTSVTCPIQDSPRSKFRRLITHP